MSPVRSVAVLALTCASVAALAAGNAAHTRLTSTAGFALSDWMGHLLPVLGNETVMDLGLPGTHDTLTYDLSETVAQNANDLPSWLSWLLHTFHSADGFVGRFIRGEAQTQNFDVTQQLEAGMRFLDIRFVYSAGPSSAVSSKVSVVKERCVSVLSGRDGRDGHLVRVGVSILAAC